MPRSAIWNYFHKIDKNNAQCIFCHFILKSQHTTTTLWTHLQSRHLDAHRALISNNSNPVSHSQSSSSTDSTQADNVKETPEQ